MGTNIKLTSIVTFSLLVLILTEVQAQSFTGGKYHCGVNPNSYGSGCDTGSCANTIQVGNNGAPFNCFSQGENQIDCKNTFEFQKLRSITTSMTDVNVYGSGKGGYIKISPAAKCAPYVEKLKQLIPGSTFSCTGAYSNGNNEYLMSSNCAADVTKLIQATFGQVSPAIVNISSPSCKNQANGGLHAIDCTSTPGGGELILNVVVDNSHKLGTNIVSVQIGATNCVVLSQLSRPVPQSTTATTTALTCKFLVTDIWGIQHTVPVVSSNLRGHYVEVIGSNGKSTFPNTTTTSVFEPRFFFNKPVISSVIGDDNSVAGGHLFKIKGSGFGPPQTLSPISALLALGEFNATSVTFISPTELSFLSPKMTGTLSVNLTVNLKIENVQQEEENVPDFSYAAPTIVTVQMLANQPITGAVGVSMTVIGTQFADVADVSNIRVFTDKGSSVTCGQFVDCTSIVRKSYNEIQCVLPKDQFPTYGCTNEQVYVTISGQTTQESIPLCYPEEGAISQLPKPNAVKIKKLGNASSSINVTWTTKNKDEVLIGGFRIQLSDDVEFTPRAILYDSGDTSANKIIGITAHEVVSFRSQHSQVFTNLPKLLWENVIFVQVKSLQISGVSTPSEWSSPSLKWTIGGDCKSISYLRDIGEFFVFFLSSFSFYVFCFFNIISSFFSFMCCHYIHQMSTLRNGSAFHAQMGPAAMH